MEGENKTSVHDQSRTPDMYSRNTRITEILEIVLNQPMTEKEMECLLLNFWTKYDNLNEEEDDEEESQKENDLEVEIKNEDNLDVEIKDEDNLDVEIKNEDNLDVEIKDEDNLDVEIKNEDNLDVEIKNEDNLDVEIKNEDNLDVEIEDEDNLEEYNKKKDFCELEALCMYMIDCVFKRNGPNLSAVSRSLFCFLKCLDLSEESRIDIINGTENNFVNALRDFTDFNSLEGENILIDALLKSLLDGNFGLAIFLLKFGLVEIPTEVSEKSRKIVQKLVDEFNDILHYTFANEQAEDLRLSLELDGMLDLMTRSNISLRRSLMTFFVIVVISEYRLHVNVQFQEIKEMMQNKFTSKLVCLYQFFDETTEIKIKMRDIETFVETFFYPLLGEDFGKSLIQFSRNNLCAYWDTLHPRSLQDLTRSVIRKNLQNSMMFPEQVNQFHIPADLKEFLLFHCEEIFHVLRGSHNSRFIEQTVRLLLDGDFPNDLEN